MASLDEIGKRFAKMNLPDDTAGNGGSSASSATGLAGAAIRIFDSLKKFEVQV